MAKGQKRSNREVKKPKAVKPKPAVAITSPVMVQSGKGGKKLSKAGK